MKSGIYRSPLLCLVWMTACCGGGELRSSPVYQETGCYGSNGNIDVLNYACASGSQIAVKAVYAMTKKNSTGCPVTSTETTRDAEKCCTFSDDDCKMSYSGWNVEYLYACHGYQNCSSRVLWKTTECNTTTYLDQSNYMLADYYCIPDSMVLNVSEDSSGFLYGPYHYLAFYDDFRSTSGTAEYTCSVTASCGSKIVVTAIHMTAIDATSDCQFMKIRDGVNDVQVTGLPCDQASYKVKEIYTSVSNFLSIAIDEDTTTGMRQFWIELKGDIPTSNINLTCGALAVSVDDVENCSTETTTTPTTTTIKTTAIITTATTTGSTTVTTTTTSTPSTTAIKSSTTTTDSEQIPAKPTDEESVFPSWVIAVIVTIVVVVVGIIIAAVIWYKKKKTGRFKVQGSDNQVAPIDSVYPKDKPDARHLKDPEAVPDPSFNRDPKLFHVVRAVYASRIEESSKSKQKTSAWVLEPKEALELKYSIKWRDKM